MRFIKAVVGLRRVFDGAGLKAPEIAMKFATQEDCFRFQTLLRQEFSVSRYYPVLVREEINEVTVCGVRFRLEVGK